MTYGTLSGWGRYPQVECHQSTPRSAHEIAPMLAGEPSLIARGMGRSYGDAALNPACTLLTRRMNRMLAFDDSNGSLTAESGVVLADILTTFIPRGWFPPVTPGTKYVTLGGMFAADVHGKNHHVAGSFGDYVEAFDLMLADGHVVTCSPAQNADLFAATRGGMGLTGIILRLTFRLKRIETSFIRQEIQRARNLDEVMEQFEASKSWSYSVAWIDCLAHGDGLGRSLLYRGEHATLDECTTSQKTHPLALSNRHSLTIPPLFPFSLVGHWSVRAFNALYFRHGHEGSSITDYERFFYPLDMLHAWNRLYGRKGFVQYQCVLPKAESKVGMRQLLSATSEANAGSFFAVLKLLGRAASLISFPMEGYTLALDFPANASTFALLSKLDGIVASHGGRVYLAKDARTSAEGIRQGYPGLQRFEAIRQAWQAGQKFSSLLSERLGL